MANPGNPNGAVVLLDGETPRTFTAKARAAISGGEFVFVSGATGVVGSGADSYASSDILVALSASADRVNGMALQNAGSNSYLTILQRGGVLAKCGGSVFGGMPIETIGDSVAIQSLSSGAVPSALHAGVPGAKNIGRAITDGASGGFAFVYLNL